MNYRARITADEALRRGFEPDVVEAWIIRLHEEIDKRLTGLRSARMWLESRITCPEDIVTLGDAIKDDPELREIVASHLKDQSMDSSAASPRGE